MKYIVVIPARIGSKRFPNKNIYPLNGLPLISHSVEYALNNFDENLIWVNTDSSLISDVVNCYGINVFYRPEVLGNDYSTTADVLKNHVENLIQNGDVFDAVILLQPTNPLRGEYLLKNAIVEFEKNTRSSLATFSKLEKKYGSIENEHFYPKNYTPGQRTQDLDADYFEDGLIYITKVESILKGEIITSDVYPLINEHIYSNVDIDYYEDLLYAEFLIKNKKNNE